MTEHVKQKQMLSINRVPHAWSVTFPEGTSAEGIRGDLARNMVAQAAVGNVAVRNDFDRLEIYRRPIFNATWDSTARRWKDFVKQGEEGFTFSPTEENREVVYRCRPFWYKIDFSGANGPSFISVTDRPLEGYKLAPMFKNGKTYEYRPCFEMGIGEDGKPHSRAGLLPVVDEPGQLMTHVHDYDSTARTEKMADWFSEYLLMLVEFGTRNLSAIMPGFAKTSIPMNFCTSLSDGPNLGFYAATPDAVTVGQKLRVTYVGALNAEIWNDVTVQSIDTEQTSLGYYVEMDLPELDTMIKGREHKVHPQPRHTGSALPYLTNATSGTYGEESCNPCVWRGKENPWGNISSLVCDVALNILDSQTAIFYQLPDLCAFDGTLNDAYIALASLEKKQIGYGGCIKTFICLGEDHMMIPGGINFSAQTSYWACSTQINNTFSEKGLRFVRVGGDYASKRAATHGTYEYFGDANMGLFGARLVLEEGC